MQNWTKNMFPGSDNVSELNTVTWLLVLAVILRVVHQVVTKAVAPTSRRGNSSGSKAPLPPGPPGAWPILGSLPEMWRNMPAHHWMHRVMNNLGTDIASFQLGSTHVVVVTSTEIGLEFLKTHDAVFQSRPVTMATATITRGYLTTALNPSSEQWKKMRRVLVSEVLSPSRTQWLLKTRNMEADDLVRLVHSRCSSGPAVVDLRAVTRHFAANLIRRIIFGRKNFGSGGEGGGPGAEEEEHVTALFSMLLHIYAFCISDCVPWLGFLDLDGHQGKVSDAVASVRKYHDPIVEAREREWSEGRRTEPEDILDVLISLRGPAGTRLLSGDEIHAQVTEMFLAGVDNPYNIAIWALMEMLGRPEVVGRAVAELDAVVGRDRLVAEDDVARLPYLVACAREVLRLHPVAPFNLPHVSVEECQVAGYRIPKGSHVYLSRHAIGRCPRVWDDPLRFDPGRHLAEGGAGYADLAEADLRFVSFGRGRRGCVGVGLGSNMTVMLLGRLLHSFKWDPPEGLEEMDLVAQHDMLSASAPVHSTATPRLNAAAYSSLLM